MQLTPGFCLLFSEYLSQKDHKDFSSYRTDLQTSNFVSSMALDLMQTIQSIEVLENYIERIRPPENMRAKLDVSYKIDGQSIIIHEIRPSLVVKNKILEPLIAKATYVRTQKLWKVFWRRATQKWEGYAPHPTVKSLNEFVDLVEEDKYHCFWG
jgi:hypothetical protein